PTARVPLRVEKIRLARLVLCTVPFLYFGCLAMRVVRVELVSPTLWRHQLPLSRDYSRKLRADLRCDRAHLRVDVAAEQLECANRGHSNENEDQSVLGHGLALFTLDAVLEPQVKPGCPERNPLHLNLRRHVFAGLFVLPDRLHVRLSARAGRRPNG